MPVPESWSATAAVSACPPIQVRGEVWRFHLASRDPLDASGYLYASGRFHRGVREFGEAGWPALYLSSDQHIALGEYLRHRVDLSDLRETALTRVAANLSHVLDCRDPALVGLTLQELLEDTDYAAGQALAAAAIAQGYEGLIVPTATRFTGWNLVFFSHRRSPTSKLVAIGTESPHLYVGKIVVE